MNLILDDEKINFELENEKTLWDIIKSFDNYLNEHKRHIVNAKMNSNIEIDLDDVNFLKACPIDDIQELKISSNTLIGSAIDSLVEIKVYIEKYIGFLDSTNSDKIIENVVQVVEGLKWIVNGIMGALYTLGLSINIVYCKTTFLKEIFNDVNNIIPLIEKNNQEKDGLIKLLDEKIKPNLKNVLELINVIRLRIYFNLMYNKNDAYKNEIVDLFKLNLDSIASIKNKLLQIKVSINSNDEKICILEGKRFVGILGIIVNDIISVIRVFNLKKVTKMKINDSTLLKDFLQTKLIVLKEIDENLLNKNREKVIELIDKETPNIFKDLSDIINNIIENIK